MGADAKHFQSPLPKPAPVRNTRREIIAGALEQAKTHLNMIQHNPLATKRQHVIIARYEAQLREIDEQEWLT